MAVGLAPLGCGLRARRGAEGGEEVESGGTLNFEGRDGPRKARKARRWTGLMQFGTTNGANFTNGMRDVRMAEKRGLGATGD
jgi:hypothetical protein